MLKLIHTDFIRVTLTQEVRVVVPAIDVTRKEFAKFKGCHRKLQMLIPESPEIYLDNDILPEQVGPNRTYKLPTIPPNVPVRFHLRLDQFLVAACEEGFAETAALVEYWREER